MENKQKKLNTNELEKVNGGIVVPVKPDGLNPKDNNGIVIPVKPDGLNPKDNNGIVIPVKPGD